MPGRITGTSKIFQLRLDLRNVRPPIWRRLQVPGDASLAELHEIVQSAMGWFGGHLHEFEVDGTSYGPPDESGWDMERTHDEAKATLGRVVGEGGKLAYTYDFGDGWRHTLTVEKVLAPEQGVTYPRCLTGRRACPPEDVGGPWGYAEFLDALSDPAHPEHDDRIEWMGGSSFDPENFSLDEVNDDLERFAWT